MDASNAALYAVSRKQWLRARDVRFYARDSYISVIYGIQFPLFQ
jgi:hypothetical protein